MQCKNFAKLFPIFVSYFDPKLGIHHRVLDLLAIRGKKAKTSERNIKQTVSRIPSEKVALCANKAPSWCHQPTGGVKRGGKKNVFQLLKRIYGEQLISVGWICPIAFVSPPSTTTKTDEKFEVRHILEANLDEEDAGDDEYDLELDSDEDDNQWHRKRGLGLVDGRFGQSCHSEVPIKTITKPSEKSSKPCRSKRRATKVHTQASILESDHTRALACPSSSGHNN